MAKVIQVIEMEVTRGKGVFPDPLRGVKQYWSLDGDLLAENDPCLADTRPGTRIATLRLLHEVEKFLDQHIAIDAPADAMHLLDEVRAIIAKAEDEQP